MSLELDIVNASWAFLYSIKWLLTSLLRMVNYHTFCSCFRPALDVPQLLHFLLKLNCLSYFLILLKHCSSLHDWKVYFHRFFLFLEMCKMPTGQFFQMVWWIYPTSSVGQLISHAKSRKCPSCWFIFCNLLLYFGYVSSGIFNQDWSEWLVRLIFGKLHDALGVLDLPPVELPI